MTDKSSKSKTLKKAIAVIAVALLILLSLISTFILDGIEEFFFNLTGSAFSKTVHLEDGDVMVAVLDVGQAESIFIKDGNTNVLIDAGDAQSEDDIVKFLKSNGVKKLDYLINTHPHSDHIGGMRKVIKSFEVGNLIFPEVPKKLIPTNELYTNLLKTIEKEGVSLRIAERNEVVALDNGRLEVIYTGPADNLNDCSTVMIYRFKNISFMLTGDIEMAAEREILSLKIDLCCNVLKLGHHGSSTSTGKKFLDAVNPEYAVASVGVDNSYNHPHKEVTGLLKDRGIKLYRTDYDGDVVFVTDGEEIEILTLGERK